MQLLIMHSATIIYRELNRSIQHVIFPVFWKKLIDAKAFCFLNMPMPASTYHLTHRILPPNLCWLWLLCGSVLTDTNSCPFLLSQCYSALPTGLLGSITFSVLWPNMFLGFFFPARNISHAWSFCFFSWFSLIPFCPSLTLVFLNSPLLFFQLLFWDTSERHLSCVTLLSAFLKCAEVAPLTIQIP